MNGYVLVSDHTHCMALGASCGGECLQLGACTNPNYALASKTTHVYLIFGFLRPKYHKCNFSVGIWRLISFAQLSLRFLRASLDWNKVVFVWQRGCSRPYVMSVTISFLKSRFWQPVAYPLHSLWKSSKHCLILSLCSSS